jgi:hypothetical protein
MRLVQSIEPIDPREQIGRNASHDAMHLTMHIGVKPAEIGDAGRRTHAAEEAIAFDEQRAPPGSRGSHRGRDAGGTNAEHGGIWRAGSSIVLVDTFRLPAA